MPFFFTASLVGLKMPEGSAINAVEGTNVALNRNTVLRKLTKEHRWVLFIDDDMLFEDGDLRRLLLHDVPMVSAICPARRRPYEPACHPMDEAKIASGKLVEVDWVGAAFLLVRRDVIDAMEDPWFRLGQYNNEELGEDKYFSLAARAKGFPIYVDTSLRVGHQMDAWIRYGDDGKPQIATI